MANDFFFKFKSYYNNLQTGGCRENAREVVTAESNSPLAAAPIEVSFFKFSNVTYQPVTTCL